MLKKFKIVLFLLIAITSLSSNELLAESRNGINVEYKHHYPTGELKSVGGVEVIEGREVGRMIHATYYKNGQMQSLGYSTKATGGQIIIKDKYDEKGNSIDVNLSARETQNILIPYPTIEEIGKDLDAIMNNKESRIETKELYKENKKIKKSEKTEIIHHMRNDISNLYMSTGFYIFETNQEPKSIKDLIKTDLLYLDPTNPFNISWSFHRLENYLYKITGQLNQMSPDICEEVMQDFYASEHKDFKCYGDKIDYIFDLKEIIEEHKNH